MSTDNEVTIGRRRFLKDVSFAGLAGMILPRVGLPLPSTSANSRVIFVDDEAAVNGGVVNQTVVRQMLDSGIRSLAQTADIGEAWKTLLIGVNTSSRIGIKINCQNSALPTRPELTWSIADSLQQMQFGGVPFAANQIYVFDNATGALQNAGYQINKTTTGVQCFGGRDTGVFAQPYDVAGVEQFVYGLVGDTLDYIINAAVLKDHGNAGITLCMKNHFGTIDKPENMHTNRSYPYIAALNAIAPIRSKQTVYILDGLFAIITGGPEGTPQLTPRTLIFSSDVVAADFQGRKFMRELGWSGTADYIDAAATIYGLGTNDPSQMDVVQIHNPSTTGIDATSPPDKPALYQNFPNPFNPVTVIRFDLARNEEVLLRVLNVAGQEVRVIASGLFQAGTHSVTFDARGLASGTYFCDLSTLDWRANRRMILVK